MITRNLFSIIFALLVCLLCPILLGCGDDDDDDDLFDDDASNLDDDVQNDDDVVDDDATDDDEADDDVVDDDAVADDDVVDDDVVDDDAVDDDTTDDDATDDDISDEQILLAGVRAMDLVLLEPAQHAVKNRTATTIDNPQRITGGAFGRNGLQMFLDRSLPVEAELLLATNVALHDSIFDESGNFHVVFCRENDPGIYYATDADGSWSEEKLNTTEEIMDVKVAVTDTAVHIAYVYSTDTGLYVGYLTDKTGSWQEETFEQSAYSVILFADENDAVYLFTCKPGTTVDSISNATGEWVTEALLFGGYDRTYLAAARDDDGFFHLAMVRNGDGGIHSVYAAYYITNLTGEWVSDKVSSYGSPSGSGAGPVAIVLDNEEQPVVVLFEGQRYTDIYGIYSWRKDEEEVWQRSQLASDGSIDSLNLARNQNGKLIASYYQWLKGQTIVLAQHDQGWTRHLADAAGYIPGLVDLALDADGHRHICFYDVSTETMQYATDASGAWVFTVLAEEIGMGYPYDVDWSASLTVDSTGAVHIAFPHFTLNQPMYATNAGGSWAVEPIVEELTGHISYLSLSLDGDDVPHVAYSYGNGLTTLGSVVYARPIEKGWSSELVLEFDSYYAKPVDLEVEADGTTHLVVKSGGLQHATNASGDWVFTEILPDTGLGKFAFALDGNGNAYAVVFAGEQVLFADNISGDWQTETVMTRDDEVSGGTGIDLAIDDAGWAHAAFGDNCAAPDYGCERIYYADNVGGTWENSVVIDEGDFGQNIGIALDNDLLRTIFTGYDALWSLDVTAAR